MDILEIFKNKQWIQERPVTDPYVIAEIGVNHEGSMDLAKLLINEAKEGGADAVKFQSYKAQTLAMKNSPSYWDTTKEPTRSQYELFKKHDKFWKNEFEELKKYCDQAGIEFMSTPFDVESATFLNNLMRVYKISSSDLTNKPFIQLMCNFGKPIILSTGASNLEEVKEAVGWVEPFGNPLALLHCILNYPTENRNANLGMILGLKQAFPDRIIGYSDHTLPWDMRAMETAVVLGSRILEKHFTHDKSLPGNDHYHAMDKHDLKLFRRNMARVLELVGSFEVVSWPTEQPARQNARRSLVAARTIPQGKVIEKEDLTWKRPACGISPREIDEVIGRRTKVVIAEDSALLKEMLE
ncbi:MAG: N-acetylneuraminate synthase family protein [Candidatus Omnitrophica bacterium]|nr:N-acetylneuraminate synthase family protein [Candidatus Omnitrophota bacterium]